MTDNTPAPAPLTFERQEEWRAVAGYEGLYEVSDHGNVVRLLKGGRRRQLRPGLCRGYLRVCLSKGNEQLSMHVHRLVAIAFIANPDRLPEVNHKNGIRTWNRVENLEWTTPKENTAHAFRTGLRPRVRSTGGLSSAEREEIRRALPDLTDGSLAHVSLFSRDVGRALDALDAADAEIARLRAELRLLANPNFSRWKTNDRYSKGVRDGLKCAAEQATKALSPPQP